MSMWEIPPLTSVRWVVDRQIPPIMEDLDYESNRKYGGGIRRVNFDAKWTGSKI